PAKSSKPASKPPYPFILDALAPLDPEVRRMFSGFAIYSGNLLILMLREHATSVRDNGLWLVLPETTIPHEPTLRRDFPPSAASSSSATKFTTGSSSPPTARPSRPNPSTPAIYSFAATPASAESPSPAASSHREPFAVRAGPQNVSSPRTPSKPPNPL
ncbi:TfoX/Sxy family protein, partial [Granulicella sp. L46]|uniref:TfoX/Sxy family protein n=1 Tax=Granulicella sp. L46 TaxID=1641865 RepID=UPI001C20A8C6